MKESDLYSQNRSNRVENDKIQFNIFARKLRKRNLKYDRL